MGLRNELGENAENKAWKCAGKGDFKTAWSYTQLVFKLDSLLIKKENAVHKQQDLEARGRNK